VEIPGARIQVDSFKRGSDTYFLSHFHSDHMTNLRPGWSRGPLYVSPVTAKLLTHAKKVDPNVIRCIEPGEAVRPEGSEEVTVRAFDANHCPGALMFVFDTPSGRVLHTGDFRYDPEIHRTVQKHGPFDLAFIDATYDAPHYVFPPQKDIIRRVLELTEENLSKDVYLGLYTIGKTRIVKALVERFERPFYVTRHIYQAYRAMGAGCLVTADRHSTNFYGFNLGYFGRYFKMNNPDYRSRALVIIPTGWTVDMGSKGNRDGFHYVAYSEHCDWRERRDFMELIRPKRVVDMK